ncbi:MAG: Ig-like domain-containing protein [Isosphaeraceae bacterium]
MLGTADFDSITASMKTLGTSTVPVVQVGGLLQATIADVGEGPETARVIINGLEGRDSLVVDSTLGGFTIPITYDGGTGFNDLRLQGGTATSDQYYPGPAAGQGISRIVIGGVTQIVAFDNLSPVFDSVAGPLMVNGTLGNDTITYTRGVISTTGQVTVNDFEAITFTGKTALTLNGLAGQDTVTINNTSRPSGLTAINVTGNAGTVKLVVDANGFPVLSSNITVTSVNIADTVPIIPVNYDETVKGIEILHAQVAYNSTPLNISGSEGASLIDVPVASFNFSDPATPVVLGRASDFSATIDWGDGSTSPGTVVGTSGGGFVVQGTHKYAASGSYTVSTAVTDLSSQRNFTTDGATPVTIQDIPGTVIDITPEAANADIGTAPLWANGVPVSGAEGVPLTTIQPPSADVLVATFQDTGTILGLSAYAASINWGDGHVSAATRITVAGTPQGVVFSVFGTNTYAVSGTYTVIVTITKTEGTPPDTLTSVDIAASTAFIADAEISISVTQPVINTVEAARFPVPVFAPPVFIGPVAAFTYGSSTALVTDFEVMIDWGDGTTRNAGLVTQPGGAGTEFIVIGRHTYADAEVNGGSGTFTVQVFIEDLDGTRVIVRNTATVADRAIALSGVLNPASDSGKFNNDAITNINQPNFYGTSEPFSDVVLYANGSLIGQAEANSDGAWSITSNLLSDGSYAITAQAIDQFGVTTTPTPVTIVPALVIDTIAPRMTYAAFDRMIGTAYYTFQDYLPDQHTPGGTGPLVQSLEDSANFSLNRVHTRPPGTYIVSAITVAAGTTVASNDVTVVFNNGSPLKGGYFQLIARSKGAPLPLGIQDRAGNALDGEFYGQQSATGNGVQGGDFVANLKSLHGNTPGYGYSGPLTVLGYPHPNDPPSKFPTNPKPRPRRPAPVSVPKPTRPVTTKAPTTGATAVNSTTPLTMGSWFSIRERLMKSAAASRGLG